MRVSQFAVYRVIAEEPAVSYPPSDDVHVDQQSSQLQIFVVAVLQRYRTIPWSPTQRQRHGKVSSRQTLHSVTDLRTCLQAVDGECGLSQEVLVIEHVDLIHHKAQEGEGRVAHGELESLSGPGGIQAIISWRGWIKNTTCFKCAFKCTRAYQESE